MTGWIGGSASRRASRLASKRTSARVDSPAPALLGRRDGAIGSVGLRGVQSSIHRRVSVRACVPACPRACDEATMAMAEVKA